MPTNKPTLYGVFLAIDEYGSNVSPLKGCKNDIAEYRKMLNEHFGSKIVIDTSNIKFLSDGEATYDNVIKAFDIDNFSSMKKDDIFLFIYTGHGSREKQAKEFDRIEPSGISETLVLHDSRTPDGKDLADKEIGILLYRIGKKCDNITVIFDSCHSGSGVRGVNDIVLGSTRQTPEDFGNGLSRTTYSKDGTRKYESYLDGYYKDVYGNNPVVPFTKLILLSACDKKEKARELSSPSQGAFSRFLIETINENSSINCIDLMDEARFRLSANHIYQSPRINAQLFFNAYNTFLLNRPSESKEVILKKKDGNWTLRKGAIDGILSREEIFLEIIEDDKVTGKGKISSVYPEYSHVTLEGTSFDNREKLVAKFLGPYNKLCLVNNISEGKGNDRLQTALSAYSSLNFQIKKNLNVSQFALNCTEDRVSILDTENNKEIIAYSGTQEDQIFSFVFEDLEHIGQWQQKLSIENKACQFDPSEVKITFTNLESGESFSDQELVEISLLENYNKEFSFHYKINVENLTPVPISCSLLYFGPGYQILEIYENLAIPSEGKANFPIPSSMNKLKIDDIVKPRYAAYKITNVKSEATDIFKIFVTTSDFIGTGKLNQKSLQRLDEYNKYGVVTVDSTTARGGKRDLGGDHDVYLNQWLTKSIIVKTTKKKLNLSQQQISVSDKVSISAPKGISGDIITKIIPKDSRSLDEYSIVNQLVNLSNDAELFLFDSHRSVSGTPNCLEIQNVQNQEILQDSPLVIAIDADDDSTMIPLTYDGEHFIPMDIKDAKDGKYIFELNHLPQRTANRSLTQAIKLFFVKISGKKTSNKTHMLKFVDYSNGKSSDNQEQFTSLVTKSTKPLLLVHGIIGNTKQMVQVGKRLFDSGKYDLVMTFNYENLNTPIEATSGELLDQLKLVGFSKDKKITILSHSMGGLVSRCMIEQLSGYQLVKMLVVVGVPNEGSKVAEVGSKYVVQWLPIIFFFLNLVRDFSQIKKIFALASGKLKADKTLNQMTWEDPDRWLKNLSNAPDPKIPYHIIYGDLDGYLAKNPSSKRLMQKAYKLGGKLFYRNKPSDMVVSEPSMTGVPQNRIPTPTKRKVPSIHTSYFEDKTAIDEILKVL